MAKKKFKAIEKKPVDAPVKENLEWEGEELQAESKTKLEEDKGDGQAVVLRFFEFKAIKADFEKHQPTAQELFNLHIRGMESMLWVDGLKPFTEVAPRLMFSKDKTKYRFVIPAIASGSYNKEKLQASTKTLSEIANESRGHTDEVSRVV